jgi:hypothetical protein
MKCAASWRALASLPSVLSRSESTASSPAPVELAEVLSPEWLTYALSQCFPGAVVRGIQVSETIVTMATKVRFVVEYASPSAGIPRHFCLKGLFGEHIARMRAAGVSATEARFYTECRPLLTLRGPRCVYAGIADDGPYAVILMEDVIVTGARFLSALNAYSEDQAASSLDQLARLHAGSWAAGNLDRFPWLTSRVAYFVERPVMTTHELQQLLNGDRGVFLAAGTRDAVRLERALKRLVDCRPASVDSLVHGDCHAGNVYEDTEGASLVDWQLLQRGS